MTAIAEFATKQKQYNERMAAAIDGLKGDVENLYNQILALQTSPGKISAEDQATLDALQAAGEELASKLEVLDLLTPPVLPGNPQADVVTHNEDGSETTTRPDGSSTTLLPGGGRIEATAHGAKKMTFDAQGNRTS